MFKPFLLLLLLSSIVFSSEKVEIFATNIKLINQMVHAEGEVNVVYKDYYISAKKAQYNKENGVLELYENIRVTQGNSYKILGEYARLNIEDKQRDFKPFYMLENQTKVWMSAKEANSDEVYINVDNGTLSGCNPNKPLWKMEFSSSDYNQDTKWLNTYNNRLYIYDILVFYTPYFGYSLDRTRRTGLLRPSLGLSSDEGFYYEQTLYIAEQNWWDLELKPQIRTLRGSGLYSEFRFVDSKASSGSLKVGAFKEKDEYYEDKSLENQKHYGLDFEYKNTSFLNDWFSLNLNGQSEIYVDLHRMNDVDYINLSTNDTTTNVTAQQILSRVNMFYNDQEDYLGSYIKYYQQLSPSIGDKRSIDEINKDTLQQLPVVHYHHYLETLFDNHFMYNLDVKGTNIYRSEGVGALQADIDVPITLQTSLFDDYLNVAYKTFFYAQATSFTGLNDINISKNYNDGYFAKNYSVVQASTSLVKAFNDYTHLISFGANYTFGGIDSNDGYYENYEKICPDENNNICEFYSVSDPDNGFEVEFSQYLFDKSGTEILFHRLSQNLIYNDDSTQDSKEYGDLENELNYKITNGFNFYNNIFYSHDEDDFSRVYNRLTYNGYGIRGSLAYLYKNNFLEKDEVGEPYSKYLTSSLAYKYDEHYSYNIVYNYDVQTNLKKNLEVGFLYKKRCWDFGLRYVENNRPILSSDGDYNSVYDRYVYFTILLRPLMDAGSNPGLSYKLPEPYKGK